MKNKEQISEKILIAKSQKGDGQAFRLLIDGYRRRLFGYLFKIMKNKENAEDVFQDTMLKIWKNIADYKNDDKFASFLFSVAHNSAMDAIRKNNIRKFENLDDNPNLISNSNSPIELITAKETRTQIEKVVDDLPEKQRKVFLLRQHGGLPFKEIAEILNEPLNTVLSRMRYASIKIKNELRRNNEYKRIN